MAASHRERLLTFFLAAFAAGTTGGVIFFLLIAAPTLHNAEVALEAAAHQTPAPAAATATPQPTAAPTPKPVLARPEGLHPAIALSIDEVDLRKAGKVMANGDKYVFVLGTDMGFLKLALNSILSLRSHGLHEHVLVYCYDVEVCNILAEAGVPTILNLYANQVSHYFYSHVDCPHGTRWMPIHVKDGEGVIEAMHAEVMLDRAIFHADLMNRGFGYFIFDADVCFRKNPSEIFFKDLETDVIVSAHISYRDADDMPWFAFEYIEERPGVWVRLNNGVSLARSRPATKSLTARMVGLMYSKLCQIGFAQGCFNKQLWDEGLRLEEQGDLIMVRTEPDENGEQELVEFHDQLIGHTHAAVEKDQVKVRTVPFSAYYNGCEADTIAKLDTSTMVHANCADDKRLFLQTHDCYFLRDDFLEVPRTGDMNAWLDRIDMRTM